MENKVVYEHRKKDTGEIFYIGIGNKRRPYIKSKRNKYWKDIEKKHGRTVHIIYEFPTKEQCEIVEVMLIEKYGRIDNGTGCLANITRGGDGIHDMDTNGEKNPFYGKKHTEETKRKIAEKKFGISPANKGKKASKESRKKMSEKAKLRVGEKNPFYGKKHTEESRNKMGWNKGLKGDDFLTEESKLKMSMAHRGEKARTAVLVADDVLYIRENCKFEDIENKKRMAKKFGVSHCSINDILKRRSWKHI